MLYESIALPAELRRLLNSANNSLAIRRGSSLAPPDFQELSRRLAKSPQMQTFQNAKGSPDGLLRNGSGQCPGIPGRLIPQYTANAQATGIE